MIIYNVTIQLQHNIEEAWVSWMKETHIPDVMNTNCFEKFQMVKLLEIDETDGVTYAVQYYASNYLNYKYYTENFAKQLQQQSFDEWGNQFIAFRSIMQIVN